MNRTLVAFDERIAGHSFHPGCKVGLAQELDTGYILKVADGDDRGARELQFYERVWTDSHPQLQKLRQFIAKFHGCVKLDDRVFIRLENVSLNYDCVMDVKIGARTWDKLASDEKILAEKNKFSYGQQMGFRILGFKSVQGDVSVKLTKDEAKATSSCQLVKRIAMFLSPNGDHNLRKRRKESFLVQLNDILSFIGQQNLYEFVSSSLLLSYNSRTLEADDQTKVTMIDFAHTYPLESEKDDNYFSGLENFIKVFSSVE